MAAIRWRQHLASRSLRRVSSLLAAWMAVALLLFTLVSRDVNLQGLVLTQKGAAVNGRLLLQQPPPPVTADASTTENLLELEPLVDRSPVKNENAIVEEVQRSLPSLPLEYWSKTAKNKVGLSKNGSCAKYPSPYELEFNNIYWQTLRTSNGTFQLYGAYYDVRHLSRIGPAVRILGMLDRIEPKVKTFCQFWFEDQKEPAIIEVMEYKYIWYKKWGNYKQGILQPYLIACKLPPTHKSRVPISVSLVERPCDTASNNLRVLYNTPPGGQKKGFAVCVKGLDFLHEDLSVRMVEWIELLHLLGADKIFMYKLQVHPNISKVLDYYQQVGKVEVTPLTLPGTLPNIAGFQHMYLTKKVNHKRQNELIPYNDCLYKNLYMYEHIALLDVDEVIMPIKSMNWQQLMSEEVLPKALLLRNETRASYNFRNVYFLDELSHAHGWFAHMPRYMHMLQHVYRSKNFTKPGQYVKCFHNPERVLTLHNHFPLACLGSGCTSYPVNTSDAQLQHYRADCVKTLKKSCTEFRQNSTLDTTIWKYTDKLVAATTDTLRRLGFFRAPSAAS
ncbi:uncharacterized protein LOC135935988 [Cloeon dipterum]|uniref:Glycosyltransferase family 92 protein n=1 Tax=Cloeon dipterum TaxID=197152 RepID=A0A8S1CPI1_9INSE|nr:Hypothetical predicted protein [Cloeon dipterum]